MTKKKMRLGAALLAATMAFSVIVLPKVQAALPVETDKTNCSVQINVPSASFRELENLPVTVKLYKVADISVEGKYVAMDFLHTLDFSGVSSTTTAQQWEEMAALAKEAVEETQMDVTAEAVTEAGTVTVTDLATGLYLVDAQSVTSDYHQYDFTPYLISLPNHYYYDTEDDTWVYDLVGENAIGLKPEKVDLYGDLVINKLLDVYNETIGGATFVFQIEASKTDVDTGETKVVYSDVVSMTFKNPGTDSITIKGLPAGSNVVVTEVYSGASYKLTSEASQTVTILAEGAEDGPASVAFTNTYNEHLNGGNGVVNHFAYNSETGEWTHTATEDSTP